MPTLTKRDIVIEISNKTGLTQQSVYDVLQKSVDLISARLADGDTVVLRNFGAFHVKRSKSKIGRNPNRPEDVVRIPERAIVKFKPGKRLRDNVGKLINKI